LSYEKLGDGTVRDNNTGLVWQQGQNATRLGFYQAKKRCEALTLGGLSPLRQG